MISPRTGFIIARFSRGGRTRLGLPTGPQQSPKDLDTWTEKIEKHEVQFGEVVRLRTWQELSLDEKSSTGDCERKQLGDLLYESALDALKQAKLADAEVIGGDMEVSIFPVGCGTYVTPDGRFWYTIIERAIEFDWSLAHQLLTRVQALYDRAAEIWPVPVTESQENGVPKSKKGTGAPQKAQPRWRERRKTRSLTVERDPHARRAYELCTSLFSAINLEKLRRDEQDEKVKLTREPSPDFEKRVMVVAPEISAAEAKFDRAAQRYARGRYGQGMVLGVVLIGLICGALAFIFDTYDVPAWYGVATLAGGVGAIVSVLQRMATGKLKLEYDAGAGILLILGSVRPVIGAIFGTVLFCAVEGGWLPAVQVESDHQLAFYAVLGFLAGFNERFAQDMLVASAAQVNHPSGGSSDGDPSPGKPATQQRG